MLDEKGREIPDPIPVEVPIQWRRPPTIQEQIKMFVKRELSMVAEAQGVETFEEADDFDVDDDIDPTSPYEENFDVYETPRQASSDGSTSPGTPKDGGQPKPGGERVLGASDRSPTGGTPSSTGAPA